MYLYFQRRTLESSKRIRKEYKGKFNQKMGINVKKKFLVVLIIVLMSVLIIFCNIKLEINRLEKELRAYLVNEKHYDDADILRIEGHYGKLPKYPIQVTFKDEPNVVYIYTDRQAGQWVQLAPSDLNKEFKHREVKR
jgi:hypothetical protein